MKNFKKRFGCLVVLLVMLLCVSVKAASVTDYFKETFIGSYSFVDSKGHWGNFEYFQRKSDGKVAYCIEPGISKSDEEYIGYYDLGMNELAGYVSLTEEQLNRVSLIAYFGYGYQGNTGYEWIVATQSLIWRETGRDFQFTSRIDEENPRKYIIDTPREIQEKMDEIERNIAHYLQKPSIDNQTIKIAYGTTHFYNDPLLEGYEVKKSTNATTFYYKKNELVVTPHTYNGGEVLLEKKISDWDTNFIVYQSDKGQNMLVPGNVPAISVRFDYEVVRTLLKLKKYDAINRSCFAQANSSLEGSIYGLYRDDGSYVMDLIIDVNCNAMVSDLPFGRYYIQETKAGKNYSLDPNKYYVEFYDYQPQQEVVSYEELLKGQIRIEKYDSKNNTCSPQGNASLEGAIYGIYKKDGTLIQELTLNDCEALSNRDLDFGDYYVQEIKAPKGYKLDLNQYAFNINEDTIKAILPIVVTDEVYESYLKINKYYLKLGIPMPEDGAVFEIYLGHKLIDTLTTDKNGQARIKLPYGTYTIKQIGTIAGYYLMEDSEVVVDENSLSVTEVTFYNKPFKGNVEINKFDEASKVPLVNATFKVCTTDEECLYEVSTGEDGKILIEGLEYGSYYIQEIQAPLGYALKKEKIYFEIVQDEDVVELDVFDEQEVRVPNTGLDNKKTNFMFLFLIVGGILYKKKI